MKIIHTGDWHIGKIVNEFSMLEDQIYILEQLVEIIRDEKPDALIIAGDIYDRSIPPVDAVELVDEILNRVVMEHKVNVLAVAGNHDSAERLSFASRLLTANGLHIAGVFDGNIRKVVLQDAHGPVSFYMLPYMDPRVVRHILKDDDISTHDDAMKKLIERLQPSICAQERNIVITHGYVGHGGEQLEQSESERPLSIGGADFVNAAYFNAFTYTALGHLHAPQRVGADHIRYSGSLLKYSFSEENQKKGIYIVDIDDRGRADIQLAALRPKRDMRTIKGPVNKLLSPAVYNSANTGDYIYAILTDKGELIDPMAKLRTVYPNIMGLSKESGIANENSKTSASDGYKTKSKLELFEEFYASIQGEPLGEEAAGIMENIIQEAEKEAE